MRKVLFRLRPLAQSVMTKFLIRYHIGRYLFFTLGYHTREISFFSPRISHQGENFIRISHQGKNFIRISHQEDIFFQTQDKVIYNIEGNNSMIYKISPISIGMIYEPQLCFMLYQWVFEALSAISACITMHQCVFGALSAISA